MEIPYNPKTTNMNNPGGHVVNVKGVAQDSLMRRHPQPKQHPQKMYQ